MKKMKIVGKIFAVSAAVLMIVIIIIGIILHNERVMYREYIPEYGIEILILSEESENPFDIIPHHTAECTLYVKQKGLFGRVIYKKPFLFRDYKSCFKNYSRNIVKYHVDENKLIIELKYTNSGINYNPRFYVDI